jgi:predicted branched-subunit amino acid permease
VLDLWYAPLPLATLALTVLAVNARHILLGAALAPWLLQIPIMRRLAALLWLSDANFALAIAARERGEVDAGILFGSSAAMWLIWIASTAVGALAGPLLGDLSRFGFDAVMVTFFAAVVVGQWKGTKDLFPWLAAAAVAVIGTYVLPPGWHIIAGALAGGIVGTWRHG